MPVTHAAGQSALRRCHWPIMGPRGPVMGAMLLLKERRGTLQSHWAEEKSSGTSIMEMQNTQWCRGTMRGHFIHSSALSPFSWSCSVCVWEGERRKKRGHSHPSKKRKKELCEKVGLRLLFALSLIWSGPTVALVSPSSVWISQSDDEENQHRGF